MSIVEPSPAPPSTKEESRKAMQNGKITVMSGCEEEYPTLLHTIVVKDGANAVAWYEKALGATVYFRYEDADGRILHCVLRTPWGLCISIEDHDPFKHMVQGAEKGDKLSSCSYVYVTIPENGGTADEAVNRMRECGATVVEECQDMFYGHRMGKVIDCYGMGWVFGHKIECTMDCTVHPTGKETVESGTGGETKKEC